MNLDPAPNAMNPAEGSESVAVNQVEAGSNYPVYLGLEEEFFVLEQGRDRPTLQSMNYLRRFVWKNPKRYLSHAASNFAKGTDRDECFMGSIELSTDKHPDAQSLIQDLVERRTDFAKGTLEGQIIATGALFGLSSPTNTACSHVHVGVPAQERVRVYRNLCHFAPILAIHAANSPYAASKRFGLSYRMAQEGLLGSLRDDPEYRFQDIIISKRLGTIEMRIFDPMPELDRLQWILETIAKIAAWPGSHDLDIEQYNRLRRDWVNGKPNEAITALGAELADLFGGPPLGQEQTLSERLADLADAQGIPAAYAYLDELWRGPTGTKVNPKPYSWGKAAWGMAGYYIPKLPLIASKGFKEWYGKNGLK